MEVATLAMTSDRPSAALASLAARICSPGPFRVPGLVIVVRRRDGTVERLVTGTDALGTPLASDTLFPLGSNGKLPLGLLVLRLIDAGAVALRDPIQKYVPGAAAGNVAVTIERLLTHTSGLPIDLPAAVVAYGPGVDRPRLMRACAKTPLQYAPGSIVQYSGVGFGLLAEAIEAISGEPLWQVVTREVLRPLNIEAYPANDLPTPRAAVIADIRSVHTGTPHEPVNGEAWRALALPWAGLFGTADAVLSLVQAYDAGAVVSDALLLQARSDRNIGLPGGFNTTDPRLGYIDSKPITWPHCAWGLCVEVRGPKAPHWTPAAASRTSFGHLGSTGCLAWTDPDRGSSWAVVGPQTTDNGWLLRYGPALGDSALRDRAPAAN